MKQTIEIPDGFELKKVSETEYQIIKKEKTLPKTWEEFHTTHLKDYGYYINPYSNIDGVHRRSSSKDDRNLLPSKEEAEAILALCQLIQLRDCYNDGWKPDWTDGAQRKYCISTFKKNFEVIEPIYSSHIMHFKTSELAKQFCENFNDLLEIAKPLL